MLPAHSTALAAGALGAASDSPESPPVQPVPSALVTVNLMTGDQVLLDDNRQSPGRRRPVRPDPGWNMLERSSE
jgi:hypothetical protein